MMIENIIKVNNFLTTRKLKARSVVASGNFLYIFRIYNASIDSNISVVRSKYMSF